MLIIFIILLLVLVLTMAIVNSRVCESFELQGSRNIQGIQGIQSIQGIQKNIIFTMTTFLSLPGKLDQFYAAMESMESMKNIQGIRKAINKIVVINEYNGNNGNDIDYAKQVKERYPFIEFVQKGEHQKGQAVSLNMILDMIVGYEYWVHWEESWMHVVDATTTLSHSGSFLTKALDIMNRDKSITQLQFTPDWTDDVGIDRLEDHGDYIIVALHSIYKDIPHDPESFDALVSQYGLNVMWPLYSLRPSINRVAHYLGLGKFDEDPRLWPVRFEYEYSLRWVDAGCVKAVIVPPIAVRQANHVSTYA